MAPKDPWDMIAKDNTVICSNEANLSQTESTLSYYLTKRTINFSALKLLHKGKIDKCKPEATWTSTAGHDECGSHPWYHQAQERKLEAEIQHQTLMSYPVASQTFLLATLGGAKKHLPIQCTSQGCKQGTFPPRSEHQHPSTACSYQPQKGHGYTCLSSDNSNGSEVLLLVFRKT